MTITFIAPIKPHLSAYDSSNRSPRNRTVARDEHLPDLTSASSPPGRPWGIWECEGDLRPHRLKVLAVRIARGSSTSVQGAAPGQFHWLTILNQPLGQAVVRPRPSCCARPPGLGPKDAWQRAEGRSRRREAAQAGTCPTGPSTSSSSAIRRPTPGSWAAQSLRRARMGSAPSPDDDPKSKPIATLTYDIAVPARFAQRSRSSWRCSPRRAPASSRCRTSSRR